jgi:hypothetical protein
MRWPEAAVWIIAILSVSSCVVLTDDNPKAAAAAYDAGRWMRSAVQ